MDAKIEQLTAGEHEWIEQQIAIAQEFVQRTLNKDTGELPSPEDLDQAFNSWLHSLSQDPSDANSVVNCVGVAFGQHLVDSTPLEWVIASDSYGTELALYGLPSQGDILVYPQNFVAKRYEANVGIFIAESVNQIRADVSSVMRNHQKT
jgi:Domain of unknown function (DUF3806)